MCDSGLQTIIRPDYTKGKNEVYLETARQLLLQHGDLRQLGAVAHTEESLASGCPTWVSQWDLIRGQQTIGCRQDHYPHILWIKGAPSFRIGNGSRPRLEVYGMIYSLIYSVIVDVFDRCHGDEIPSVLDTGRRIFRTRESHLSNGIVQHVAKAGDVVALLHTSFVPCVLRHVQRNEYNFIAACFVQPLQDIDEANSVINRRKTELQKIILI